MKHLLVRFCCLIAFLAGLFPSADADSITLKLSPGRAAHSFYIYRPSSSPDWLGAGSFVDLLTSDSNGGWLELQVSVEPGEEFSLYDSSANEYLSDIGAATDLRQGVWGNSGVSNVYFMIPWELRDRQFAVSQLEYGTIYLANKSSYSFTPFSSVSWGEQFEASSTYDPTKPFRLIDLTNSMQAPIGLTNLINAQWTPADPLLVVVKFFLEPGSVGQMFTVHSRRNGGPEHVQNVVATATNLAGYISSHIGQAFSISQGDAEFSASIAEGAEFWVTRADAVGVESPHETITMSPGTEPNCSLFWVFPPTVLPDSVAVTVPRSWDTSNYIYHDNGEISYPSLLSEGTWYSYDSDGVVIASYDYSTFLYRVDNSQNWYMRGGTWPAKKTYYCDDWSPPGPTDPPSGRWGTVRLAIQANRAQHPGNLQFCQSDGTRFSIPNPLWDQSWWTEYRTDGSYNVTLQVGGAEFGSTTNGDYGWLALYVTVPYDTTLPYWVEDGAAGNESSPVSTTDLTRWFYHQPRQFAISTSRWGHDLWLVYGTGDYFPVQQIATNGDFSLDLNGTVWFNSYYSFSASADSFTLLEWWIEDTTTGERSLPFSDGYPGINYPGGGNFYNYLAYHWIPLPPPLDLSVSVENSAIRLTWNPNGAAVDGAFEIEGAKIANAPAPWPFFATEEAGPLIDPSSGLANWIVPVTDVFELTKYRVRYRYGNGASVPSNVASVPLSDTDSNGLPEWWEGSGGKWYPSLGAIGQPGMTSPQAGTSPTGTVPTITSTGQLGLDQPGPRILSVFASVSHLVEDSSAVEIIWTPATGTITGYRIYRREEPGGSWSLIASPNATAQSYTDSGLLFGLRYFYRVVAISAYGETCGAGDLSFTPEFRPSMRYRQGWVKHLDPHEPNYIVQKGEFETPTSQQQYSGNGTVAGALGDIISQLNTLEMWTAVYLSGYSGGYLTGNSESLDVAKGGGSKGELKYTLPVDSELLDFQISRAILRNTFVPPSGALWVIKEIDEDPHQLESTGTESFDVIPTMMDAGWGLISVVHAVDARISNPVSGEAPLPELTENTEGLKIHQGGGAMINIQGPFVTSTDQLQQLYSYTLDIPPGKVDAYVGTDTGEVVYNGDAFQGIYDANDGRAQVRLVVRNTVPVGTEIPITVHVCFQGAAVASDTVKIVVDSYDSTIPLEETAGPRYRKVGLNGRPIADSKPQVKAGETQEPEETFVDAMTLQLRHSTTDIYIPLPGSDMSLSVRRDNIGEVWTTRNGLRPHERPDRPFGVGWETNLGASLEISWVSSETAVTDFKATVRDCDGVVHSFVRQGSSEPPNWVPMPGGRYETESYLSSLSPVGTTNGFVFQKKGGAKVWFGPPVLSMDTELDREIGSRGVQNRSFRAATAAEDRVGNRIEFAPGGPNPLVPKSITATKPLGGTIQIAQNDKGLITDVWDANRNRTKYRYQTKTYVSPLSPNLPARMEYYLSEVEGPDGAITRYTVDFVHQTDTYTPLKNEGDARSTYWFCNLASIKDPMNRTTSFTYEFDLSKSDWNSKAGYFFKFPVPRWLKTAQTAAGTTTFENQSNVQMGSNGAIVGQRRSVVKDALQNSTTYDFIAPQVFTLSELKNMVSHPGAVPKLFCYTKTTITHGTLGTETFTFDPDAGMALSEAIDLSGNKTTFTHEDFEAPEPYRLLFNFIGFNHKHSEPKEQINAAGDKRKFTYGVFRQLESVEDEEGNLTDYELDGLGRVITEVRTGEKGGSMRTEYEYNNADVPGLPTLRTIVKSGDDTMVTSSLVVAYEYETSGQLKKEIVDPGVAPAGLGLTTEHSYDDNGNKLLTTDANGNATAFSYDARNRLIEIKYPGLTAKTFTYDDRGNKLSETDENGDGTTYGYDSANRLISVTRGNAVTRYEYNAVGSETALIDPRGYRTEKKYDALQRLIEVKDPLGRLTTCLYGPKSGGSVFETSSFKPTEVKDARGFRTLTDYDGLCRPIRVKREYRPGIFAMSEMGYDMVGNLTAERDPRGNQTVHTYDSLNRKIRTTFADTSKVELTYSSTGLLVSTKNERGFVTRTGYDAAGRAVEVIGPADVDSPRTQTFYDKVGNVVAAINPLGVGSANPSDYRWDYVYDARNRKVKEMQPAPSTGAQRPTWKYGYDAVGRRTAVIDPRGYATFKGYDAMGRLRWVQLPQNGTEATVHTYDYDPAGNLVRETNELNHATNNVYDKLNRLTSTTDAAGIRVRYEYDEVGNRTKVYDGKDQLTEFAYDGLGRVTMEKDALGRQTTYLYDGLNKTLRNTPLDQTSYEYNNRNRLKKVRYSANSNDNRDYTYDAAGNLLDVFEPERSWITEASYEYDALNRVIMEMSYGYTHGYQYDLAGNRTNVTYGGSGRMITSTYDRLNRLRTMTEGGRTTGYQYDLAGNVTSKFLPNQDVTITQYDARNRATSISAYNAAEELLYSYGLQYDAVGNLKQSTESYAATSGVGGRTLTLSYDNANRLIAEQESGAGGSRLTTHSYDNANNRTSKTVTGAGAGNWSFTYNALNQLTSSTTPAGSFTYGYDFKGNRTSRSKAGGETTSYAYDGDNRLITVGGQYQGQTLDLHYLYDYRGRRVQRTEAGIETSVVFSGGTSVQEWSGGVIDAEYLRGSDWGGGVGGLLYSLRPSQPIGFTHYNHRGDVVAKTDGVGTLTWQAAYEGFGTRRSEWGATADRQKANTKDEDPSGLLNEGHRYRDLETGVFLTRDPAGFVDGPNLYAYVRQNPWSKFDPDGLFWKEIGEAGKQVVIAGGEFVGGAIVGWGQANVNFGQMNPVQPGTRAEWLGLQVGHTLGIAQGIGEAFQGTGLAAGGLAAVPETGPLIGGGIALVGAGEAVHGAVVSLNGIRLFKSTGAPPSSGSGGNSPEPSAKKTGEESQATVDEEKTYQTYTKPPKDPKTHEPYAGRTSGTGEPAQNVARRDRDHHMNETHGPAVLDKSSSNSDAIRGREQTLIESNGGAQSTGGTSGNRINGIAPNNPKAPKYKAAEEKEFGS